MHWRYTNKTLLGPLPAGEQRGFHIREGVVHVWRNAVLAYRLASDAELLDLRLDGAIEPTPPGWKSWSEEWRKGMSARKGL